MLAQAQMQRLGVPGGVGQGALQGLLLFVPKFSVGVHQASAGRRMGWRFI